MMWEVSRGYRTDNPANEPISVELPNNNIPVSHCQALPYSQVVAAVAQVRHSGCRSDPTQQYRLPTA